MKIRYNDQFLNLKIGYVIEYLLLHFLGFILKLIPLRWELVFSIPLGGLLYRVNRKRRLIAIENLQKAFPEKPMSEIISLARKVYVNLVSIFFEFMHLGDFRTREKVLSRTELVNWGALDKSLQKGRGVIVITSHFGNWELEGAMTCALGGHLNAIYFQQSNFLADSYFNMIRQKAGLSLIYKKYAFRGTLKALGKNEIVAFLSDQDAGGRDGVFVNFFNRPASTFKGPVYFALKTGAPVLLASLVRVEKFRYKFILEEIPMISTGDLEKDILTNTQSWSTRLEELIRTHPEQWFWVHRRWKTVPQKQDGT
jgi:Kdo2-lipid IVA lauroyltransferase/acyltransferase